MSLGKKSYREKPHFVATREHSKTLIIDYPHLRFLSRLFHTRYEDSSTGGQQRWRWGTTGYRVDVNTGRHVDLRATMYRCSNYHRHRSPPSIVGERRTRRADATTWPGRRTLGHIDPGTWYLVFLTFAILNLCLMMWMDTNYNSANVLDALFNVIERWWSKQVVLPRKEEPEFNLKY